MTASTREDSLCPRPSDRTADYLPEIYRQAAGQSTLLRGILGASDELLLGIDRQLDDVHHHFDAHATSGIAPAAPSRTHPAEPRPRQQAGVSTLSWLASWLDLERHLHQSALFLAEACYTEQQILARRRIIVASGAHLARLRGTRTGLERMLWCCFGILAHVAERQWSCRMRVGSPVGQGARLLNSYRPARSLEVIWRCQSEPTTPMIQAVRRVIDYETPAHLRTYLAILPPDPSKSPPGAQEHASS